MTEAGGRLLRRRRGAERVTNVELYFDLVYVFAVTQLSRHLLARPTITGALQSALLLAMVWLVWAYTTWVTNWLDPERIPVRLLLIALALAALVMWAALPEAFGTRGLIIGAGYAVTQIGRSIFAVVTLRGGPLERNFQRILVWCVVSGGLAVAGGIVSGPARGWLWLAAVTVDLVGGMAGFYTPGLGRSATADWTIEGNHFAERCQAFILIALGESIVVIGATLSRLLGMAVTAAEAGAFVIAVVGSAGLWWLYFDRSAGDAARVIAASADPGRMGRTAYHLIHPVMVAGIIVAAAADEVMVSSPGLTGVAWAAWLVLGGTALFIAGHAAFKIAVWRVVPWSRLAAVAVLGLLGLAAPHVSVLGLGVCATAVVIAVAASDHFLATGGEESPG
ncbi:MAG TPA: low temperature requirement protein A [Streptosporangiaceae bacterium]|nr:low temperature requirement protein A [Streptosporangiaceae bacterium]